MRSIFLTLFVISFYFLQGQDIKSDLTKIKKSYDAKEFTANISYTFFSNGKKVEDATALHIQSGNNYYYKIKDIEVVNNSKCQLIANHISKSISVLPAGNANEYKELSNIPIDTALKEVSSSFFVKESNDIGKYTIELKRGKYNKVEIYFNTQKFTITKLKLYISNDFGDPEYENGVMEVAYTSFQQTVSEGNKALLTETRFVTIKSGKVTLVTAFNEYELNNYLNIKPE